MTGPGDVPAQSYRKLVADHPGDFENPDPAGIVILDGSARAEAEAELSRRMAAAGNPPDWARAGLYYEDPWIRLVRDVVRFPDGAPGTYHRMLSKHGDDSAAVLPRRGDRLLLVRHFRHGLRDWSLEFPRGSSGPEVKPEDTARLELREELGLEATALHALGFVHGHNNLSRVRLHLFLAEVGDGPGVPAGDEGIADIVPVSAEEFEALVLDGTITDSATLNLFQLARLRGLL